jgi:protein xylosyltransferase
MIGCYKDSKDVHLLPGSFGKYTSNNYTLNKDVCIKRCRLQGYSFAGIQFGYECYCGEISFNDLEKYQSEEKFCTKKKSERCDKELSKKCDRKLAMMVYHTGVSLMDQETPELQKKGENYVTKYISKCKGKIVTFALKCFDFCIVKIVLSFLDTFQINLQPKKRSE